MSAAKLAALHGWRRDASLTFVARSGAVVTLRDQAGALVELDFPLYRELIAEGFAKKPDTSAGIDFIPDEYGRRKQEMKLAAIRRDAELRENGNSAAGAFEILKVELLEDARHSSYVPTSFNIRTLQMWKKALGAEGPNGLLPRNQDQGHFGPRHDEEYEECVFEVLEQLFLKSDRVTIRVAAAKAEKLYRDRYTGTKEKLGDCALRSFLSVMSALRADDVIKARHDTETAKRLTLQARFYARVEVPFDVVEIDSTVGDVFLSDIRGVCIGRPVICAAIDAASGFPLAIRISLESASEKLTIQTIKEIMLPRGAEFFERLGIENRINTAGVPRVLVSDQGSENSGKWLPGIIAQSGMEWAKNIPGCPEKKPHVERFFLELNRYLRTLPGATTSKTMPHRARIEKGMFEASITVEELEGLIYKWIYDVYATKIRRLIHSPLRVAESPLHSWNRMVNGIAQLPLQPNEVHQIFMVKETKRSLQHYGLDVGNVQYSSPELCELLSEIGRKSTVEVRYDPTDIRAIAVVHNRDGIPSPMIVPAKSEHVLPIAFEDVARIKKPSNEAKAKDLEARATAADLAQKAQELAEQRGKGRITSLRKARKAEAQRRKVAQVMERAKTPPLKSASVSKTVNQPTPRMAVRRREPRPQMDILEQTMNNTAISLLSEIVLHDSLRGALSSVDFLLSTNQAFGGCLVPLLGPTRVGKKSVARHLLSNAGPATSLFPMDDVVYCSLPPQSSGKSIYGAILAGMGQRILSNENTKSVRDRLFRAIDQLGIQVVVIDEVNHLIERGANLAPREAADHLKTIVDETGVGVIAVGLPRFQRIIDENEQLRDRACATTILKPYDWQVDAERDAFAHTVDVALHKLEQSGFPVAIEFEDIVRRLYGASAGRIPVMMRVLKLCALATREPRDLELADFALAARAMQQSGIPTSSFFIEEEPDEVDILRSFACTMAEAGLEFSVDSLAGLDLAHGALSA